jgi:alpha-ketoglutarate-dependent taurine dioxygenase
MKRLSLQKVMETQGYVFLARFGAGLATQELLSFIGEPVSLSGGNPVHSLSPRTVAEAPENTYSGAYGLGTFPLHTDLAHWYSPPRYLLLRCVVGFEAVPTVLVDGKAAVARANAELLARALMQPRRPLNGKRSLLFLYDAAMRLLRWDERYIVPASAAGAAGAKSFREALDRTTPNTLPLYRQGDMLVIDNWRMLHGRSPVPEPCKTRVIERAYFRSVHP